MARAAQPENGNQNGAGRADSPLLSATDVSAITGLSVETLAQWRSQRRGIPFVKISRNFVRYRQCDLDAWLTERIVRVERSL